MPKNTENCNKFKGSNSDSPKLHENEMSINHSTWHYFTKLNCYKKEIDYYS